MRDDLQTAFSDGGAGGGGQQGASQFGTQRGELFGARESGQDRRRYRDEDDSTRGVANQDLLQQQQQIMRDQDAGLDILQESIRRQKEMGLRIGNEIDDQNEMLDELGEAMDRTDNRLQRRTEDVITVTMKAKDKGMCCLVFLQSFY